MPPLLLMMCVSPCLPLPPLPAPPFLCSLPPCHCCLKATVRGTVVLLTTQLGLPPVMLVKFTLHCLVW